VLNDIVVACARWTGKGRPTQSDLDALEVRDAYNEFTGELRPIGPLALIASEPPPKRWSKLGRVKAPAVDVLLLAGGNATLPDGTTQVVPSHAGFDGIARNVQRAWRLARDPSQLLAAEAAADAKIAADNAAEDVALAAKLARRRRAKLSELAALELLPEWDGLTSARNRATVVRMLTTCVAKLRATPKAGPAVKLAMIAATVEQINAWNDRTGAIETPEREALCTAIDDIGRAAGLRGHDLAGPYRDW